MIVQSNRRFSLYLIIGLFSVIYALIFFVFCLLSESSILLLFIKSSTPALTLTFLLTSWPKCYSYLVRMNNWISFLPPLLDLNGEWQVNIESNWPRIEKLTKKVNTKPKLKKVTGTLKLKCNFFQTSGYFEVDDKDSNRNSRTYRSDLVASSLRKENDHFLLSYIAKANVKNPDTKTDEQHYLFSSEVTFQSGELNQSSGYYWTNRKYNTGHNAAGELQLIRK